MTLNGETKKAGGGHLARQTADEWNQERHKGTIRPQDIKYILWDWQNDRVELLEILRSVEWASETIDGVAFCPECGGFLHKGHRDGCKLGDALA